MKRAKRLLVLALSFMLIAVFTVVPFASVFAESGQNEEVAAVTAGTDASEEKQAGADSLGDAQLHKQEALKAEADEDEEDDEVVLEVGGKAIIYEKWNSDTESYSYTYHLDRLPAGVTFTKATVSNPANTLTLNNVTIKSAKGDMGAYIYSGLPQMKIVLKGKNELSGSADGVNGIRFNNYEGVSGLTVIGSGEGASLKIDLSKGVPKWGGRVGINASSNLRVENCNMTIIGGNKNNSYFYGLSLNPETGYECDDNAAHTHEILVKDSTLNISNTMPSSRSAWNVGIDSQDADLTIKNSNISINNTGGIGLGLGTGQYNTFGIDDDEDLDDDEEDGSGDSGDDYVHRPVTGVYGGLLSIDAVSSVIIRLNKSNMPYSIYYYNTDAQLKSNIKSPFIYSADPTTGKGQAGTSPLRKHDWITVRYECLDPYLDFSPYKITLSKTVYTYTGTAAKPLVTVKNAAGATVSKTVSYSNNVNVGVGVANVTVKGLKYSRYFKIVKAKQPMQVKAKTAKIKFKKLKKKNQTVTAKKALTVSKAQGTVSYKLTKVSKAKFKKYFKVNAKTGKITAKKKLKKGTYKLTIKVTAAGSKNYAAGSKTVTVKIKVK